MGSRLLFVDRKIMTVAASGDGRTQSAAFLIDQGTVDSLPGRPDGGSWLVSHRGANSLLRVSNYFVDKPSSC